MIGPFEHRDFATLKVNEERLVAVLPLTHPLTEGPRLLLRDLADCDFILGDIAQWEFYRLLITDVFSSQGLSVNATLEVSNTLAILGLVAEGLGVSLYPEGIRRFEPRNVVVRDIDDCEQSVETILAWRKDRMDPMLAQFVECCRRELAGSVAR